MTGAVGMQPGNNPASAGRYLVFTAFVCGAIIMVIELIGSRVIGPPFGVSLFVWTSLITVTLVSLAIGYWAGGRLADAKGSHGALFGIILLSGVFVSAVPLAKGFVIEAALGLGLRAGSLVSSTVLFGPPLLLLGMVTPYTVKLYMTEGHPGVGRTVGWLYAVSTCGSFVGTILTGFVLIPSLGVNNIIYLSSFALIALSAAYWVFFRRRFSLLALAAVPVALLAYPQELPSVTRPDGTRVELVEYADTAYGQIKVVDYSYGTARVREFLLENMTQGGIEVSTKLSISRYTYYIEELARAYKGDAKRALVIGLGAGIVPRRFAERGIRTDVVEINQGVVDAAEKHFFYDTSVNPTYVEDGRSFLRSSNEPYDIIVLDAFSGDTPPSHLVSLEAFRLMKARLAPDGVLLINFGGGNQEEDRAVPASLSRTLKEVFPYVDVYPGPEYVLREPAVANMIFTAYGSARSPDAAAASLEVYPPFAGDVAGLFGRKAAVGEGPVVFTDDYNPIDFYDHRVRERIRAGIISTADREIAVY